MTPTPDDAQAFLSPPNEGVETPNTGSVPPGQNAETTNPSARVRARRGGPDYRLKGVDLSAQTSFEPPIQRRRSPFLRRRMSRILIQVFAVLSVAALAATLLRLYVFEPYTVASNAMAPRLRAGDQILIVRWSALVGSVGRGDIVAFHPPAGLSCGAASDQPLIERVVGLPGETISSRDGKIYVDGHRLNERGWYDRKYGQLDSIPVIPTRIPRHDYFVLNDNRSNACDSRTFGLVPRTSIVGTVVALTMRGGHPDIHFL
jgi:signal peptidase I